MSKNYLWKSRRAKPKPSPAAPKLSDDELTDLYISEIAEAMDVCSESEGFICIAVKQVPYEDKQLLVPLTFGIAMTKEASVLIDAQLLQVAASAYSDIVRKLGA